MYTNQYSALEHLARQMREDYYREATRNRRQAEIRRAVRNQVRPNRGNR